MVGFKRSFWRIAIVLLLAFSGSVLLLDGRTVGLAANTCWLCLAVTSISLPLGGLLAVLLWRTDLPGRNLALFALGWLFVVPLYLQAGAWQAGFGLQGWFTIGWDLPHWFDGWIAAIFVHAAASLPWVVLIVGVGLWTVERDLEEQSLCEMPAIYVLLTVSLRRSAFAWLAAGLWIVVQCATEMTVTDLFRVRTYAEELYSQMAAHGQPIRALQETGPGWLLLVFLVVAILWLATTLMPALRRGVSQSSHCFVLGFWRWPALCFVCVLMFILVGVPLASLIYQAGLEVIPSDGTVLRVWSPGKVTALTVDAVVRFDGLPTWGRFTQEIGRSVLVASCTATLAMLLSLPLAWWARQGIWSPALLVIAFCSAIPMPLWAIGTIQLLNRPDIPWLVDLYDRSILAPLLVQTIRALPIATLILWPALQTIPQYRFDQAAADGLTPWWQLFSVVLPQRKAALVIAWLLGFCLAFGELGATMLVAPAGFELVSVHIFNLLHAGVNDLVASLYLALLAMFGLISLVLLSFRLTLQKKTHVAA